MTNSSAAKPNIPGFKFKIKHLVVGVIACAFLGIAGLATLTYVLNSQLPPMISLKDYDPLLVSQVYDRGGNKIGEFTREKRTLVPFNEIPKVVLNAFIAAEDSTFFQHGGINYFAILRAVLKNLQAGEKAQGASTITQQVARSLLLSREKTYTRKIKEILLSYQMEENLSKEDILYLYLNQIFLGHNSYGIVEAAKTYFNKELKDLTIAEAAILAALPKAPSTLNPISYPTRAKDRQLYVIGRMLDEGMITKEEAEAARIEPVKVFMRKSYSELAPSFLDTVKALLVERLGEEKVLDDGLKIFTTLDLQKQLAAQKQLQEGLRELDKRQGYRGPLSNLTSPDEIAKFLLDTRNDLLEETTPFKILQPDGTFPQWGPLNLTGLAQPPEGASAGATSAAQTTTPSDATQAPAPVLPEYVKPGTLTKGIVTKVDDEWGLVYVRFAEARGLIDVENMKWARTPDPNIDSRWAEEIKKPSKVLKQGDVILIRAVDNEFSSSRLSDLLREKKQKAGKTYTPPETLPNFKEYAELSLEQEPEAQAALLALDQRTDEVVSMVGGYKPEPGQLNRTYQTARQTGSSFKTVVYAAALDHGYTPASMILDAPIVYEEEQEVEGSDNKETIIKKWKPTNHSNEFLGDILFRNALIQSLNVPTVKIVEKIGVSLAADYARRLGIFSPLNPDYTLALGSSSVSLYEMTKMFAQIGRMGRRANPLMIHKVEDLAGNVIAENVHLEERFKGTVSPLEEYYEKRRQNYLAYQRATEAGQPFTMPPQPSPDPNADPATSAASMPLPNPAKEPPIFFKDKDQLIKPETAYVMTSLLSAVVEEEGGTGARARSLGRPTAGKTGTTNQYYDAWFIGYTADIAAGVWVGYDKERMLGRGEVGGRAALPIWTEYMKIAHADLPARSFNVPDNIVFSSIDNETGKLASSTSQHVVRQAFIAGTEPQVTQEDGSTDKEDAQEFYKEDLSE